MSRPTPIQQERARTRIKQMIATRPSGRTKNKEKLRIGKLLGYKGKESNIIRSVDRIITTDRESPSARNLRSKDQVIKLDRSWRNRMKGRRIGDDTTDIDITPFLKPVIDVSDFEDPKFDVLLPGAVEGIGKIVFGKRRGIIRSYYYAFKGQARTFDDGYTINSTQGIDNSRWFAGDNPLGTTFGYLDNKEDLYHIWNMRVRDLFNPNSQYPTTKAIFAPNVESRELRLDPEIAEKLTGEPEARMGYYLTSKEVNK